MKIWAVPSSMLDSGRLLRHHQSIHGALQQLVKKPTKNTVNPFFMYGGYLVLRHWEAVNEMRHRGMNHSSFVDQIWKLIPEGRRRIQYRYPKLTIARDVKLLKYKQENATLSRDVGGRVPLEGIPEDLNELAIKYANGLPADAFLI